jgi:hypothetical protein
MHIPARGNSLDTGKGDVRLEGDLHREGVHPGAARFPRIAPLSGFLPAVEKTRLSWDANGN